MSYNLFDAYEIVTGLYFNKRTSNYYKFFQTNDNLKMEVLKDVKLKDLVNDTRNPIWLLRHSLGVSAGDENYSEVNIESIKNSSERRRLELLRSSISNTEIRDLNYRGIAVNVNSDSYSHAVGQIGRASCRERV